MLTLRLARPEEAQQICVMTQEFLREAQLPFEYDEAKTVASFAQVTSDAKRGVVIVAVDQDIPVAMIVGIADSPLFSQHRIASEVVWYVYPEYRKSTVGLKLLKAFEYWAKNVASCDFIQVGSLNNPRIGNLYERKGYKKGEGIYIKGV